MAGPSQRADRMSLRALAPASGAALYAALLVTLFAFIGGCTGGPHPLPPGSSPIVSNDPPTRGTATASNPTPTGGTPTFGDSPTMTPPAATGSAGSSAAQPPASAPDSGPNPQQAGAAGSSAMAPSAGTPGSAPPPTSPGTSGSAGSAAPSEPEICEGTNGALSASETAPSTMLLVLDRSADMASDFQGAPRWQRSSEALMHTLTLRANALTLGAVLYPSTSAACAGTDWLCQLQGPAMCTVTPMASQDQVAFQPASQALGTLVGPNGVYAPATAAGVPLGESLQRADVALAAQPASAKTSVVIIASGTPSCDWDSIRASAILKRWNERGVRTYVIALPGSPGATSNALAALAEAGGTAEVRSPQSVGALEAMLQSVVFDSLASCSLELDPPAADPSSVQVRVTETGVERALPRTSSSGETLWSITPDGKTVTLLGTACDAAKGGAYDAIRIVLGCATP
ncbi:MAG TPA: hypothetical protein VFG30_01930 [Polyangiales bacterium]|nr:hypothetical protein [Polyangiales bacterium]